MASSPPPPPPPSAPRRQVVGGAMASLPPQQPPSASTPHPLMPEDTPTAAATSGTPGVASPSMRLRNADSPAPTHRWRAQQQQQALRLSEDDSAVASMQSSVGVADPFAPTPRPQSRMLPSPAASRSVFRFPTPLSHTHAHLTSPFNATLSPSAAMMMHTPYTHALQSPHLPVRRVRAAGAGSGSFNPALSPSPTPASPRLAPVRSRSLGTRLLRDEADEVAASSQQTALPGNTPAASPSVSPPLGVAAAAGVGEGEPRPSSAAPLASGTPLQPHTLRLSILTEEDEGDEASRIIQAVEYTGGEEEAADLHMRSTSASPELPGGGSFLSLPTPAARAPHLFTPLSSPLRPLGSHSHAFEFLGLAPTPRFMAPPYASSLLSSATLPAPSNSHPLFDMMVPPSPARFIDTMGAVPPLPSPGPRATPPLPAASTHATAASAVRSGAGMHTASHASAAATPSGAGPTGSVPAVLATPNIAAGQAAAAQGAMDLGFYPYQPSSRASGAVHHMPAMILQQQLLQYQLLQQLHSPAVHGTFAASSAAAGASTPAATPLHSLQSSSSSSFSFSPLPIHRREIGGPRALRQRHAASIPPTPSAMQQQHRPLSILASPVPVNLLARINSRMATATQATGDAAIAEEEEAEDASGSAHQLPHSHPDMPMLHSVQVHSRHLQRQPSREQTGGDEDLHMHAEPTAHDADEQLQMTQEVVLSQQSASQTAGAAPPHSPSHRAALDDLRARLAQPVIPPPPPVPAAVVVPANGQIASAFDLSVVHGRPQLLQSHLAALPTLALVVMPTPGGHMASTQPAVATVAAPAAPAVPTAASAGAHVVSAVGRPVTTASVAVRGDSVVASTTARASPTVAPVTAIAVSSPEAATTTHTHANSSANTNAHGSMAARVVVRAAATAATATTVSAAPAVTGAPASTNPPSVTAAAVLPVPATAASVAPVMASTPISAALPIPALSSSMHRPQAATGAGGSAGQPMPVVHTAVPLSAAQAATPARAQSAHQPFIPQARTVVSAATPTVQATVVPTTATTSLVGSAGAVPAAARPVLPTTATATASATAPAVVLANATGTPTPSISVPASSPVRAMSVTVAQPRSQSHASASPVSVAEMTTPAVPAMATLAAPVVFSAAVPAAALAVAPMPLPAPTDMTASSASARSSAPLDPTRRLLSSPAGKGAKRGRDASPLPALPVFPRNVRTAVAVNAPPRVPSPPAAAASAVAASDANAAPASSSPSFSSAIASAPAPPAVDPVLLARVKIPHEECQRMVCRGVAFLETHCVIERPPAADSAGATAADASFEERKEADDMDTAGDGGGRAVAVPSSPPVRVTLPPHLLDADARHLTDAVLQPAMSLLLHQYAAEFPLDLPVLHQRCAQHALFIHVYGWGSYASRWTVAPPLPRVQEALQSSTKQTALRKAHTQQRKNNEARAEAQHRRMVQQQQQQQQQQPHPQPHPHSGRQELDGNLQQPSLPTAAVAARDLYAQLAAANLAATLAFLPMLWTPSAS